MSFIATAVGTKVAIAALSLVALGGGTAVAAAATGGFQAPVSDPTDTASATPTDDATETAAPSDEPTPSATQGPDATGPAAYGLCTAFTAGGLSTHSVAYAALEGAAGSADGIVDYCAPILAGKHADSHQPTSHPTPGDDHGQSGDDHGKSGADHGDGSEGSHGH